MRKKVISGVICALMITAILVIEIPKEVNAQVTEEWVSMYKGPGNGLDFAKAIVRDSKGNVYVTGFSYGNGTDRDYVTIAYDPSGNELWVARYNGPGNGWDEPVDMAIDSLGNIYVTGWSNGNSTKDDYATIAYDSSGNKLWVARYNGPGNGFDYPEAMAIGPSGNIYVTGSCDWGLTEEDYITIAYDISGNQLWVARYYGPENEDIALAIATNSLGNIYVTGESYNGTSTRWDYITVAYDSNGSELWVARYDGPINSIDRALAIAADSSGNVYVAGMSLGNRTIYDWDYDYVTVAYDSLGKELWVNRYKGPGNREDEVTGIAIGPSGNIFVTGFSWGNGTNYDYATVAYDPLGNQLWVARDHYSEYGQDKAYAITVDSYGNIYVTGFSWAGIESHYDIITVAYDSSGNQLWVARYNSPLNSNDRAFAITTDSLRNVYVTGDIYIGIGDYDIITIKYSQASLNQAPVANAGHNQTIYEGEKAYFNGSASYDPDGSIATYEWDFDASDGLWWETGAAIDATGPIATHIYGDEGEFTVTLRVIDNDGASDMDTCIATILLKVPSVAIDIDPNTLNLKSKGRWITCYITLNSPYDVNDINISTTLLEDSIPAEWGDIQGDTLMVKFDRSDVEDMLSPGTYNLKVTGEFTDGTKFEGYSDDIRVIDPGK